MTVGTNLTTEFSFSSFPLVGGNQAWGDLCFARCTSGLGGLQGLSMAHGAMTLGYTILLSGGGDCSGWFFPSCLGVSCRAEGFSQCSLQVPSYSL